MEPLRVIIADDEAPFRSRVAGSLRRHGIVVLGEVPDGAAAVLAARGTAPDIVIVSLDMSGLPGLEATRRLTAGPTATRVLALSSSSDPDRLAQAIEAGAAGYLLKRPGDQGFAGIWVALALLAGRPWAAKKAMSA